ncbi:hypothetical protein [Moritella sp. 28]|uniref:hypothetical protein n=1 Tax=Moritella sp. 28 TaxID=2746232 RepID=UPI001BAB2C96|nr:hypothetical protein [Moritella sp. 28]QUM86323.1 hypothetical protein HWV02_18330 [Moritella sp. 28]
MNELKATLNDAIITRIKTPLLGSFILCYMSVNIKGIAYFYLGSLEERKIILANFELWDLDLLWAFLLVFVYIGLTQFVFPILQIFINKMKYERVTKPYQEQCALDKKAHYDAIIDANEAKYKSNEGYIKTKFDKELGRWGNEKFELYRKIEELDASLESGYGENKATVAELNEKKIQVSKITDESLELKRQVNDLKMQVDSMISKSNNKEDITRQFPHLKEAGTITNHLPTGST